MMLHAERVLPIKEMMIASSLSVVLYQFGLLRLFFLVPLQVLYWTKGFFSLLLSALAVLVAVLTINLFVGYESMGYIYSLLLSFIMLAGIIGINGLEKQGWAFICRVMVVVCASLVAGLVITALGLQEQLRDEFNRALSLSMLSLLHEPQDFLLNQNQMRMLFLKIFPGNIIFWLFLVWCLTWQTARRLLYRKKILDFSRFILPQPLLICFLIVWGIRLGLYLFKQDQFFFMDKFTSTLLLDNASKILLFLIILSAIGFIEFIMKKFNLSFFTWFLVRTSMAVVIFSGAAMVLIEAIIPGMEVILGCFLLLVALPIVELWAVFQRKKEKGETI